MSCTGFALPLSIENLEKRKKGSCGTQNFRITTGVLQQKDC
jgi:hypothetical protein